MELHDRDHQPQRSAALTRTWSVSRSSSTAAGSGTEAACAAARGSFCLIGAMDHLRCDDLALGYLIRVARARHERCPFGHPVLGVMNDHCGDFEELRGCLGEARALATADLRQLQGA